MNPRNFRAPQRPSISGPKKKSAMQLKTRWLGLPRSWSSADEKSVQYVCSSKRMRGLSWSDE
jgi:hypothetical protein